MHFYAFYAAVPFVIKLITNEAEVDDLLSIEAMLR